MSIYKHTHGYFHYDNGRKAPDRVFFSTGQTNKRAAQAYVRARLVDLGVVARSVGNYEPRAACLPSVLPGWEPLSIGRVAELYIKSAKITRRKSPRDTSNYEQIARRINWIVERYGADRDLFSLTTEDLEFHVEELEKGGYAGATINHYATNSVRPLFTYAYKRLGKKTPCQIEWEVVLRSVAERTRYLKRDEMERLFASMSPREAILHKFACITALRAREIINLRWSDIDWHNRIFTTLVKGRKKHTLPITRKIEGLLRELCQDRHEEFVFSYISSKTMKNGSSTRGCNRPYTYSSLYGRFRDFVKKANIIDYNFHDHRHTAATLLFLSSGKIRLVQSLLGHSDITHCNRYLHLDVGLLAREMELMDARDFPHYALAYPSEDVDAISGNELELRRLRYENAALVDHLDRLMAKAKAMGLQI